MELGTSRQDVVHRSFDGRWRHVRNRCRRLGAQTRAAAGGRKPPALGFAGRVFGTGRVSLEDLGLKTGNAKAKVLAKTLDAATGKLLDNNKNPSPKTGQLDNRGSQFYLALYWAQALAAQNEDAELAAKFAPLAKVLAEKESAIVAELAAVQGKPADIGGYYKPDMAKLAEVMRPSASFNAALATVLG